MATTPLLPPVPDDATYRALYREPGAWQPAIRVLCERHGYDPEAAYASNTGTNVVFRVTGGPWIKLFPPLWTQDFVRERTGLAAVRGIDGLAVPQLLHEGTLEDWSYVVLSHLEGQPIGKVYEHLDARARVDVMRQTGELFAQLHAVDLGACAPIHEDWPSYARALRDDCVARQTGYGLEPAWAVELEGVVAALPPVDDGREVFLHADVTDEHLYLQERGGRHEVTGLIDFGDAMVGDWRYEFAAPLVFITQNQPAAQRALLEGYGIPREDMTPEFGRRLAMWPLLHRWGRIPTYARFRPGGPPRTLTGLLDSLWTDA